jgi:broad specificity phosphatase PhoE
VVEPTPLLRELDLGHLEGLTNDQVSKRFPEFFELVRGHADRAIPGGESLSQVDGRARDFLSLLSDSRDSGTVLVVCHSGFMRVLLCRLLGLEPHNWWRFRIDLASLTVAETYDEGGILTLLNDTRHLDPGAGASH